MAKQIYPGQTFIGRPSKRQFSLTSVNMPRPGAPASLCPGRIRLTTPKGRWTWQIATATTFAMVPLTFGSTILAALGCALFGVALVNTTLLPDRPVPLRWLIVLFATLQWVVAPALAYMAGMVRGRMGMYVLEPEYMNFAVPGVFAFTVGLFALGTAREQRLQFAAVSKTADFLRTYPQTPYILVAISVAATISSPFFPDSLRFIAYLLINLKFSALICVIFSDSSYKRFWIIGVFFYTVADSLANSLFHDMILWIVIIGLAYAFTMRIKASQRATIILFALFVIALIQSVKGEYRNEVWGGRGPQSASTYLEISQERVSGIIVGDITTEELFADLITRLNQGWIISSIISKSDANNSYAGGETIAQGVTAALVPRFLMPDKARAGGQETFRRLTGLELGNNTSMGVSILGEAYGNFGPLVAIFFMLGFGIAVSALFDIVCRVLGSHPLMLGLLPVIGLHGIKAETDFVTVVNFLVKGSILYIALFFLLSYTVWRPKFRARRVGVGPSPL